MFARIDNNTFPASLRGEAARAMWQGALVLPDCAPPRLSNEALLEISMLLFLGFSIAEIIGAAKSSSLSLIGDAGCMSIDVITYICNAYVEWLKAHYGRMTARTRYLVDVVIPSASVATLLGITAFISYDAVQVLRIPPEQDTIDVGYLYGFSTANFFVDLVCTGLFLMRDDVFHEEQPIPQLSIDTNIFDDDEKEFGFLDTDDDKYLKPPPVAASASPSAGCCGGGGGGGHEAGKKKNLNMMSAFAHVLGDLLRTISMFVAAAVSSATHIDTDICDAWAAVVVSISILAICWPLIVEIRRAAREIGEDEGGGDVELRTLSERSSAKKKARGASGRGTSGGQTYLRLSDHDDEEDDGVI